ncbi:MAG: recombinase family protein, partial [Algoriphagus sp.]
MAKIDRTNSKLKKARNLFVEDKNDAEDFNSIKRKCQSDIDSSENQISALKLTTKKDFKVMIDRGLMVIDRLGEPYENASVEEKKIILSSTFSKKVTFQDEKVRTPEGNKF